MKKQDEKILIGILVKDYGIDFIKSFNFIDNEGLKNLIKHNSKILYFMSNNRYNIEDIIKHITKTVDVYIASGLDLEEEDYTFDDKYLEGTPINDKNMTPSESYKYIRDIFLRDMWNDLINTKSDDEYEQINFYIDYDNFNELVKEKIFEKQIYWFKENLSVFKELGRDILKEEEEKFNINNTKASDDINDIEKEVDNHITDNQNKKIIEYDDNQIEQDLERMGYGLENPEEETEEERKSVFQKIKKIIENDVTEDTFYQILDYVNTHEQYIKFRAFFINNYSFSNDIKDILFTGLENKDDIDKIEKIFSGACLETHSPTVNIKIKNSEKVIKFTYDEINDNMAMYGKHKWEIK